MNPSLPVGSVAHRTLLEGSCLAEFAIGTRQLSLAVPNIRPVSCRDSSIDIAHRTSSGVYVNPGMLSFRKFRRWFKKALTASFRNRVRDLKKVCTWP